MEAVVFFDGNFEGGAQVVFVQSLTLETVFGGGGINLEVLFQFLFLSAVITAPYTHLTLPTIDPW